MAIAEMGDIIPLENENPEFGNVNGPQISFSKIYLSLFNQIRETATDFVEVTNNGSTAIYYEWRKIIRGDYVEDKHSDPVRRFYCHHPRNILLPGQKKKFEFAFRSTTPGVFYEEWEIISEPMLTYPVSYIYLKGTAIQNDLDQPLRDEIIESMEGKARWNMGVELVNDIFERVRTPTPPLPDTTDPDVFRYEFENKNRKLRVNYTPQIMKEMNEYLQELYTELEIPAETYWDASIQELEWIIQRIGDKEQRRLFSRKLEYKVYRAQEPPLEMFPYYDQMKEIVRGIANEFVNIADRTRVDLGLPDYQFDEPVERTAEEREQYEEEKKSKIAEFYKKSKAKKPKTEEEIEKDFEDYQIKLQEDTGSKLLEKFEGIEKEFDYKKFQGELSEYKKMKIPEYEVLKRKIGVQDAGLEIEGKDVIVRVDLDVELTPAEYVDDIDISMEGGRTTQAAGKTTTKLDMEEDDPSNRPNRPRKMKPREILDTTKITKALDTIIFLINQRTNHMITIGTLGQRNGVVNEEESMYPVSELINQHIEQDVQFFNTCLIPNYIEKIEMDEIKEGSTLIVENFNFHPCENGKIIEKETGNVHIVNRDMVKEFKQQIAEYSNILINDALAASMLPLATTTGIPVRKQVMGLKMGEQVRNLGEFFTYNIYRFPTICFIGGGGSAEDLREKLLILNSLIDIAGTIVCLGHTAMYFLKALGLQVPLTYAYDPYFEEAARYLAVKVHESAQCKMILPVDLVVGKQPVEELPPQEVEEVKDEEGGGDHGGDHGASPTPTPNLSNTNQDKTPGVTLPVGTTTQLGVTELGVDVSQPIIDNKKKEEFIHWTDTVLAEGRNVQLGCTGTDVISWFMKAKGEQEERKREEEEKERIRKEEEEREAEEAALAAQKKGGKAPPKKEVPSRRPSQEEVEEAPKEEIPPLFEENEYVLEFGSETLQTFQSELNSGMKIFWDDDLSLYGSEGSFVTMPNKIMFQTLTAKREQYAEQRKNKPLVLAHGVHTGNVIFNTKEQLKVEEKRRKRDEKAKIRAEKLALRARRGEDDIDDDEEEEEEEEEEEHEVEGEEEGEGQFHVTNIVDLTCFENYQFTSRIIQGKDIPGLDQIDEHPPPTREELEEDLDILHEI